MAESDGASAEADRPARGEAITELPAAFGKYFLTEKLATGGMAEIYLAKLIGPGGFEKPLVIKQIHPRLGGQRAFVDLFVAEAKTLVTLAHGNIVPVYELGVVDDIYFIAMEYIDGPTLWRLTEALARRDAVMHPALAAWIAARVLDGLDYAHRKGDGVIHRDLSPRNVMLSRDGEVKLVDFGIAVARGEQERAHDAPPTGSFPYMSPEQVRREPLTGQTDLFSVGVLFWEMLVGQRLFARGDLDTTLAAVTGADIAVPSSIRPDVPAKLDEVVMRALDRDVTARWPSAGDMLAATNRFLYALDDTPGARDVAALVAKYCPPETRRLATHAEALLLSQVDAGAGAPQVTPPITPSGPHTAVIPRDGAAARGKHPRAPTRQESFATHVVLRDMLERGTPMLGVAIVNHIEADIDGGQTEVSGLAEPVDRRVNGRTDPAARDDATPVRPSNRVRTVRPDHDGRPVGPPAGSMMWLGAVAALGLGIAAIVVFAQGKGAVLRPDGGAGSAVAAIDAAVAVVAVDAGVVADVPADAAVHVAAVDAGAVRPVTDATVRVAVVDAVVSYPVPADARPQGTATLVVGADPWGEILVDGQPRGNTPGTLVVPAGRHTVEVVYRGVDPARTKEYVVDLLAGEVNHLPVSDFTKP